MTTLLLLKSGYLYLPYCSLESIIEKNKENYYLALRKTQGSLKDAAPDFNPWLIFFLRSLQKQKIHLEQKVSQEKIFLLHFSELDSKIINLIKDHGKLGIRDLTKITGANRNTLKKHLAELADKGIILRLGKARATWYTLH